MATVKVTFTIFVDEERSDFAEVVWQSYPEEHRDSELLKNLLDKFSASDLTFELAELKALPAPVLN